MTNSPMTPEDALRKLVVDEVIRIFKLSPNKSADPKQYSTITTTLIICYAYIHTSLDAMRYKSALDLTSPSLKRKIYPADYLTLEALRVFEPEIYAYIRSNYPWKERIVRHPNDTSWMQEWESFWIVLHAITIEAISEERMESVMPLILRDIFPPELTDVGAFMLAKRIATPQHFRTYSLRMSALGLK